MMRPYPLRHQQGIVLLGMMAVFIVILASLSLQFLKKSDLKHLKQQKTQQVLAQAKQALFAYAAENITAKPNAAPLTCGFNCPRPGDLPCPDLDNDGDAETTCNTQTQRLGRLPWKTLGLNDLKDGAGESLWYAVSNQYKNNTRVGTLNSQTLGAISLRNAQGNLIHDAATTTGLVAVIIAPSDPINRLDALQQNRSIGNINNPQHYLDIAFSEDNATFIGNNADGFISGVIKQNATIIVNDVILPLTRAQMNAVIEPRVLSEVMQAMLINFCGDDQVNIQNRTCNATPINAFPTPASVADASCLGNSQMIDSCTSSSTDTLGRIPVTVIDNSISPPTTKPIWETVDVNSILQGNSQHNWFQQNGWRELIFYMRESDTNPSLTLNHAITPDDDPSDTNKQLIILSAGAAINTQSRNSQSDQSLLINYLEEENIALPLSTFDRYRQNASRNDKVMSIP